VSTTGKPVLERFVPAFERIVGRRPTEEENREALAIADVVASSDLDPILLFYLADRRTHQARNQAIEAWRAETRSARTARAGIAQRELPAVIAFALGALLVALVSAYVAGFQAHANEVLVAVVALVAGIAIATLYYELVRR
jgi:hypothetical protein